MFSSTKGTIKGGKRQAETGGNICDTYVWQVVFRMYKEFYITQEDNPVKMSRIWKRN